jgi:hypothetical protein
MVDEQGQQLRSRLLFTAELAREIPMVPPSDLVTMAIALMGYAANSRDIRWVQPEELADDLRAEKALRPEELLRAIQSLVDVHGLMPLFEADRTVYLIRKNGSGRRISIPTLGEGPL